MLILRPEEVEGLLSMAEAVDAVEKAFADWGKHPEINLTRRRLHFGDARLNTMPAALPSREKIGLRIQSEILAVSGGVQTYPSRSPLVDVIFDTRDARPLAMILSSTRRGATTDGIPLRTSDLMTAADQRRRDKVDESIAMPLSYSYSAPVSRRGIISSP